MTPEDREKRDYRALVVADLLRAGWHPRAVSAGLKVIDATGDVARALEAMRDANAEAVLAEGGESR